MMFLLKLLLLLYLASETMLEPYKNVYSNSMETTLDVNLKSASFRVDERFLCVTIGSNSLQHHWQTTNLTSTLFLTLAKGLSPVTLRLGGKSEDFAYFVPDSYNIKQWNVEEATDKTNLKGRLCKNGFNCKDIFVDGNFSYSTEDWDVLNEFVQKVGWDLVYGLNNFITKDWEAGVWDSSNAEELVTYTMKKGYSLLAWELGNEPNIYHDPYDKIITPENLANDFNILHEMLQKVGWPDIKLAGPDTTAKLHEDHEFFSNFLIHTKKNILHAVTYHHYYMKSTVAKENDFIDVRVLDTFLNESKEAATITRTLQPEAELWLGETSSAYHGGAKGLSDAYIAGFMWLDKLGLAAESGHSKVFRQAFHGGNYALIDEYETPAPDYWLSLLYVRLVGPNVLQVINGTDHGRMVRMYAHCVRSSSGYSSGAVIVYVLNLYDTESSIHLSDAELAGSSRDVYWLEPGDDVGLLSKKVALNGKVLSMESNTKLPDLHPTVVLPSAEVSIPPLSFGFMVFKDVRALACLT